MNGSFNQVLKKFGIYTLLGLTIGIVVGSFRLISEYLPRWGKYLIGNFFYITIIIEIILSVISYFLIKKFSSINGSGIPLVSIAIKENKDIDHKFDIIALYINSLISIFSLFPLGVEGPSIVLSAKLSSLYNNIFKLKDDSLVSIGAGIGFGCAFSSFLAGFSYVIEKTLKKKNIYNVLKTIYIGIIAVLISYLIAPSRLISFNNLLPLNIDNSYLLLFIVAFNIVVSYLFISLFIIIKKIIKKHNRNKLVKYRTFILFVLGLILDYFLLNYMGSGTSIIYDFNSTSFIKILLIIIFRMLITSFYGNGGVTGGLVIPIMTLGALNANLTFSIASNIYDIDGSLLSTISVISMTMMFALCTGSPLTSIILSISTFLISADILVALKLLPFTIISILFAYFIFTRLLKIKNLYDQMVEIDLNKN